jgi:hypothetical protein
MQYILECKAHPHVSGNIFKTRGIKRSDNWVQPCILGMSPPINFNVNHEVNLSWTQTFVNDET